jgi:hypothetical protein
MPAESGEATPQEIAQAVAVAGTNMTHFGHDLDGGPFVVTPDCEVYCASCAEWAGVEEVAVRVR